MNFIKYVIMTTRLTGQTCKRSVKDDHLKRFKYSILVYVIIRYNTTFPGTLKDPTNLSKFLCLFLQYFVHPVTLGHDVNVTELLTSTVEVGEWILRCLSLSRSKYKVDFN